MRRAVVLWLAAVLVLASGMVVQPLGGAPDAAAAPTSPTDSSLVPHYFGPYPNWANSPQVLADAVVTITPVGADTGTGAEATATVDPKTGGVSAITVTAPGSGYGVQPNVVITSPGVTPTALASATAAISPGVVNSITVDETGFGFTHPSVAISGGGVPSVPAIAHASGGVDNVTLTAGGSGYTTPNVVFDLPDLPGGVQATGVATMVGGAITAVDVVNPGSGYSFAPGITILEGVVANPTPATAVTTIGIGQIDVTNGGAGYDSVPTVTITDSVAPFDKGASATATVAVKGAVTGITVTAAGAGYLTPGLKKFVDTLPGLGPTNANNIDQDPTTPGVQGQYIPVAVPDTTTYPGTDYYEIAVVQYRMKFSSLLPATLLRGYVQLATSVVPGAGVALSNANLNPALPNTPIVGYTGVDNPHYLGPTIVATKDKPVRILFRNLLPQGAGGNLFLPVDTSLMGSGPGPDMMTLDANGVPMDMAPDLGSVTDGVRNPACGESPKPAMCYTENRATLHLHGGITPWISDGTPHQWVTPAPWTGPTAAYYPKGVSVQNVPDMPDPGEGAQTFFYTNQQSARLMFYHDHAWGITRLNVYAGEAAAYLVTDAMEQSLIAPGGALAGLGVGTPLVIQDKTFVPSAAQMAQVDPTWQYAKWGGEGNLWTPHVYMPAQNPGDPTGMSAFGRWMYGPWFWPPAKDAKYPPIANPYYDPLCDPDVQPFCEPALIPSTPNVSVGMEAFNDTPIVNGTAYPTTTVDPKAYRYRILNAANDRFWNLQWYVADPRTGTLSEVALKANEVAAAQLDPNVFPTPDTAWSPVGPSWIQIGTEGGFLPTPVVVPNQPTTWITDPTRFDVGNVDQHALLLAPAERADVIVDFSQFRGKTLILYNDAPAAFPARVSSYDYYTGGPDLSPVGAPSTLAGFGPNTRTIMQVKVSTAAPATAWDRPNTTSDRMGQLMAAFAHHADGSGVFESGSDPIIVGQAAYNTAYGTNFVAAGWCNSPTNPTARCDGFARIAEQGGFAFGFNTLLAPNAKMQIPLQPKGMHDEMNSANFDDWGRMTANLGLEAPGATPLLQNIILYPYVNPPTENLDATGLPSSLDVTPIASGTDGTQIWKITHNGVDTHPIHWHLYDVQVLNRVTWDNIIMPPDPTELGWKETVRISPLEDTIVAVRPIVPTLPFGLLDSKRALNPSMPLGARGDVNGPNGTEAGFNNTDTNGNPIDPIVNAIVDFGWEYVFHCHILSHEEMDMMRPVTVHVARTLPDAPALTITKGSTILNWTDGTVVDYLNPATWGNPASEVGYRIERAPVVGGVVGTYAAIANVPANQTTYTDTTGLPGSLYSYRVAAYNAAGDSFSNAVGDLVITASSAILVYGDPIPPITPIYAGLTGGDTQPLVPPTCSTTATTGSPAGTYPSTCSGASDPKYAISYVAGSVIIGPASQTITFGPLANMTFGDPDFTVSATASSGLAVTFAATGNCTVTGDLVHLTGAGSCTITASQAGNANWSAAPDVPQSFSIAQSSQTITFGALPDKLPGDPDFTVTATASSGLAVSFSTTTITVCTVTSGGLVSLVGPGSCTITASQPGDTNYLPATPVSQTFAVSQAITATTVASNFSVTRAGLPVIFTATVTSAFGTPTGTVQFVADGGNIGSAVPLNASGQASLSWSALAIGTHTITAVYSGSPSMLTSTSPTLSHTVRTRLNTTTAVTGNLNPSVFGQTVTFTATVTPENASIGAVPTGTIQWQNGGTNVGTPVALNGSGQATLVISTLAAGNRNIRAVYNRGTDPNYNNSTSPVYTQTVRARYDTTTAVTGSGTPSVFGQAVTFTATVTPVAGSIAAVPTGTIQWQVNGTNVGTPVALDGSGQATFVTSTLAVGNRNIRAVYNRGTDPNFNNSTSPVYAQTVSKAATSALVTLTSPVSRSTTVTWTATVSAISPGAGTPTGTVKFRVDGANFGPTVTLGAGVAVLNVTSGLPLGTHNIQAFYNGSGSYLTALSPAVPQLINP